MKELLPKDKHDFESVNELMVLDKSKLIALIPELLEWLQDINWPIAREVAKLLLTVPHEAVPYVEEVLAGKDELWKIWCLDYLVINLPFDAQERLIEPLERMAYQPTNGEQEEEIHISAKKILAMLERRCQMYLYHFSEEPHIDIFHPRPRSESLPPAIWAIDEEHAVNYFFPRDCPRVIFRKSDQMSEEDKRHFFGDTSADTVIAVENDWLDRILNVKLYRYTLDRHSFELEDEIAGYYISQEPVKPLRVELLENVLHELVKRQVELRFTPNLHPIRERVISSTVDDYSIIRFRNAKP